MLLVVICAVLPLMVYLPGYEKVLALSGLQREGSAVRYGIASLMGAGFLVGVGVLLWPVLQYAVMVNTKPILGLTLSINIDGLSGIFLCIEFFVGFCLAIWGNFSVTKGFLFPLLIAVVVYIGSSLSIMGFALSLMVVVQFYTAFSSDQRYLNTPLWIVHVKKLFFSQFFLLYLISFPKKQLVLSLIPVKDLVHSGGVEAAWGWQGIDGQAFTYTIMYSSIIGGVAFGIACWNGLFSTLKKEALHEDANLSHFIKALIMAQCSSFLLLRCVQFYPSVFLNSVFAGIVFCLIGLAGIVCVAIDLCIDPGLKNFTAALPRFMVSHTLLFLGIANIYLLKNDHWHVLEVFRYCIACVCLISLAEVFLLLWYQSMDTVNEGIPIGQERGQEILSKRKHSVFMPLSIVFLLILAELTLWQGMVIGSDFLVGVFWEKISALLLLGVYGLLSISILFAAFYSGLKILAYYDVSEKSYERGYHSRYWVELIIFSTLSGIMLMPGVWQFLLQRAALPMVEGFNLSKDVPMSYEMVWYHLNEQKGMYAFSPLGIMLIYLGIYVGVSWIWRRKDQPIAILPDSSQTLWQQGRYFSLSFQKNKGQEEPYSTDFMLWQQVLVKYYNQINQTGWIKLLHTIKRLWRLEKTVLGIYADKVRIMPDIATVMIIGMGMILFVLYLYH